MGDGKPLSGFALRSCQTFDASRGFLSSEQSSIPRLVIDEISDVFLQKKLSKSNVRGKMERELVWCLESRHLLGLVNLKNRCIWKQRMRHCFS